MKLIINNSECKLEEFTIEEYKKLKELLSYSLNTNISYFSKQYGPKQVSLLNKTGNFPSGLLYIVDKFLIDNRKQVLRIDNRKRPQRALQSIFNMSLKVTPYRHQVEAVKACLNESKGIVSAVTGFGKSITMALLINKLQLRTLIIVPNLELKRQLTQSFSEFFGKEALKTNITIENIDSSSLINKTHYDCLIIDEAHHSAAKTYRNLNKKAWHSIYHRFFFTATPFRSRDEEQLLFESVAGQIIYRVGYKEAVEANYITPIEAYYFELPKTKYDSSNWTQVYSNLIVNNEHRNTLIAGLLNNLESQGKSTLCLVKEVNHGKIIKDLTNGFFAHGENEDTSHLIRFFNETKIKTLIGTTGVLGEGVDTRPAEYIIIAGLGKSKNAFMQMCGRGVRNYPGKESTKIIMFKDLSHKWTKEHFKAQCKYLEEEYGAIPVKLDL